MRVLSLFDGISCGRVALERANIPVEIYYASEIDKHAIQVTQMNYPDTIQLGDVNDIDFSEFIGKVDLLIGGSPCTNLASCGDRTGLQGEQSKLFYKFLEAKETIKPQYFLLENVASMTDNNRDIITKLMGAEPVCINSSLVSAQNRLRYYWCNWKVSQPKDRGIVWKDICENIDEYIYTEETLKWLNNYSNKNCGLIKNNFTYSVAPLKELQNNRYLGKFTFSQSSPCVAAMRGRMLVNGKRYDDPNGISGRNRQFIEFRYDGKSNALTTVGKDGIVVPFYLSSRIPVEEFLYRHKTPLECERLQTLPDNYTSIVSDAQRIKQCGNGWTVEVIKHIFEELTKQ